MVSELDQPYNGTEHYLFASYARDDSDRVLPVLRALRKSGVRVWWDHAIMPGQRFGAEIEKRLDGAAGLVVFVSSRALQSDWIQQETEHAAQKRKDLIPVMLDGSALPLEWKSLIGRIQHIAAEHLPPASIADEVRRRAQELGCEGASGAVEGALNMQPNGQSSTTLPWILVVALSVVVAVFATLHFATGGGRGESRDRPSDAPRQVPSEAQRTTGGLRAESAYSPDVPAEYLAKLGAESRAWTWSSKSALDNREVTLHWEPCKGVENMRDGNKEQFRGTVDQVRQATRGLPLRACRFCYEIEFNREMKEALRNAEGGAGG